MDRIIKSFDIHSKIRAINEALDPELEKRLRKDLKRYCEETGASYSEICKVAGLTSAGYEALSADLVDFIEENSNGAWTVDTKSGYINIDGDFNLTGSSWSSDRDKKKLEKLGKIKFGKINGDFRISYMGMKDDVWESVCPLEIEGNIELSNNELTKVILPEEVNGNVSIQNNLLESLEGFPSKVEGSVYLSNNKLKNLIGGPEEVLGNYVISDQKPQEPFSLEGCAKVIKGNFRCEENSLESMEGGPVEVHDGLDLENNRLTDLKGNFKVVKGRINLAKNNLVSLEGLPLSLSLFNIDVSKNLLQARIIKDTYRDASEMKSWIAAYLKLAATHRFKRRGKAERDPIVSRITPEIIAKNPIAVAPIWKDEELLKDPVIKRRIKKSGISKDDSFQKNVKMASDLLDLGF